MHHRHPASHADLTADYAAITREMREVAACFGREVLGDVSFDQFREHLGRRPGHLRRPGGPAGLSLLPGRPAGPPAVRGPERGDFDAFLHLVRQSGRSSFMYLQNVSNYRESRSQPVALLLALAEDLLAGRGACRVTVGALPAPSRPSSPWTCSPASSPAWRRWRDRGRAMC